MKKCFGYFGLFSLIAFSFYFTDKVSSLAYSKNKLVKEIVSLETFYNTDPKDAMIDVNNKTIIPGKYGKRVNVSESYLSMSEFNKFNSSYLVYDIIKPKISLANNKDKYIISGNPYNRNVSIIIEENDKIRNLLEQKKIKYSAIATDKLNSINFINGATNLMDFKLLNRFAKNNNRFCLKGYSNIKLCKKYNYYMLYSDLVLNSYNLHEIKSKLKNGAIILLSRDTSLDSINLLLDEIRFKNLKIVTLSKLIDERD